LWVWGKIKTPKGKDGGKTKSLKKRSPRGKETGCIQRGTQKKLQGEGSLQGGPWLERLSKLWNLGGKKNRRKVLSKPASVREHRNELGI